MISNLKFRGLDDSGKSTLVAQWSHQDIDKVSPTFGFKIHTISHETLDSKEGIITLNLWDIGGQRAIRSFWKSYYEGTDGVVWVIDSLASQRIEECLIELKRLFSSDSMMHGIVFLIILNKIDIQNEYRIEKTFLEAITREIIKNNCKWTVWECSAKKAMGTLESLNWLVSELKIKLK